MRLEELMINSVNIMHLLPFINDKRKAKIISSFEGEDRVMYKQLNVFDICMLADGHGGSEVSNFLAEHLCESFTALYYALCYLHHMDVPNEYKKYIDSFDNQIRTQLRKIDTSEQSNIIKNLLRITINKLANKQAHVREGSTLVGFVRTRDYIITFNVGDSRCYALSKNDSLNLLTYDHTFKSSIERSRLNVASAKRRRLDGVLAMTRSIGDSDVPRSISNPTIRKRNLHDYSVLVLVSDGTYEYVNQNIFKHIIQQSIDCNDNKFLSNSLNNACKHSHDDRSHLIYII